MKSIIIAFVITTVLLSCQEQEKKKIEEAANTSNIELMPFESDTVSAEPYLFSNNRGLIYLSWITKKNDTATFYYSSLENKQWTKPIQIASGTDWFVNWADYPVIAALDSANMMAHFLQKSDKGKFTYDIKTVSSNNKGTLWSNPAVLNEDGKKAEHGFVSIIPYNNGYFVSWLDGRNAVSEEHAGHEGHGGEMTLRAATLDKAGKKIKEWELDKRVCDCCQTSAAITANGPIVVYRDRSDKEIRDISLVKFTDGKWSEPKSIGSDNWEIKGCPVNGPRIVADGNNVAIAWFTSPDKNSQVNVAFSKDAGNSFGTPIKINDTATIGRVDIELIDKENAIVSWMEAATIKFCTVKSDGSKGKSQIVAASSESRSSGFPQMTRSGDQIIFAWTDSKEKTIKTAVYRL